MYSDTKEKIVNIIKESNGVSAHAIIRTLNLNASGIFRHLKKLTTRRIITKIGKPPKVLYCSTETIKTSKINLSQFGEILSSRTSGREAYLVAKAYLLPKTVIDKVEINFAGVKVLGPGWADEFLTPIKKEFGDNLVLLPSDNVTINSTLEFLEEIK